MDQQKKGGGCQLVKKQIFKMLPLKTAVKELEDDCMKQFRENLRTFFCDADEDNSGQLTINELKAALRAKGYKGADKQINCFFNCADTSGDREVSLEEYMEVMLTAPYASHSKARLRVVFKHFDKDNSGSIDKNELSKVFKELGKHVPDKDIQELMDEADKDNSGDINYEEFINSVLGCDD